MDLDGHTISVLWYDRQGGAVSHSNHPSHAEDLDIDESNEEHLAVHGVTPLEVMEVFMDDPLWTKNIKGRAATWRMIGRTRGGRPIVVAVTYDSIRSRIRPVTARTCKDSEVLSWNI